MDKDNNLSERWTDVYGWAGVYEISDRGRVRRIKPGKSTIRGRILKGWTHHNGYQWVRLYDTGRVESYMVHRLVLLSFMGPAPEGKPYVLHWDDDPQNNNLKNLRYGDNFDNARDKERLGTFYTMSSPNRNKTHCPKGHAYSPENTRTDKKTGHRTCRACRRLDYFRNKSIGLEPNDPRHGTANGYANWGCRCDDCTGAYAQYSRTRRNRT